MVNAYFSMLTFGIDILSQFLEELCFLKNQHRLVDFLLCFVLFSFVFWEEGFDNRFFLETRIQLQVSKNRKNQEEKKERGKR